MADQIGSFHTLPINAGDTCVGLPPPDEPEHASDRAERDPART
jgi:hypothetical protein